MCKNVTNHDQILKEFRKEWLKISQWPYFLDCLSRIHYFVVPRIWWQFLYELNENGPLIGANWLIKWCDHMICHLLPKKEYYKNLIFQKYFCKNNFENFPFPKRCETWETWRLLLKASFWWCDQILSNCNLRSEF